MDTHSKERSFGVMFVFVTTSATIFVVAFRKQRPHGSSNNCGVSNDEALLRGAASSGAKPERLLLSFLLACSLCLITFFLSQMCLSVLDRWAP